MLGIYFSGTGNTKYCIKHFTKYYGSCTAILSIENQTVLAAFEQDDFIVFAYPIYYSGLPKIVYDFIMQNQSAFQGKKVFILVTMGLFSGDGAGCAARLIAKCGAEIVGGLHIKMPDCIGDVKLLKKKAEQKNKIICQAERKLEKACQELKEGHPPQDGMGFLPHMTGLIGQRLWFGGKTKKYTNELKIDHAVCTGCGKCVSLCPMKNLYLQSGKAETFGRCTMCYRCFSHCPVQAITLLGKRVYEQYYLDDAL